MVLSENQIHIWLVPVFYEREAYHKASAFLSSDEIARRNEYLFEKDQMRFAFGRYYLKSLAGLYLSAKPDEIQIGYQKYGKPFFLKKKQSHLKFNVSHSGGIITYAFSLHEEVGVDIEKYDQTIDVLGMSDKYFSRPEKQLISESKKRYLPGLFYNIWVCKEAYLKYRGAGLRIPPGSFSVYPREENILSLHYYRAKQSNGKEQKKLPQDKYFLALCTPHKTPKVKVQIYQPHLLLPTEQAGGAQILAAALSHDRLCDHAKYRPLSRWPVNLRTPVPDG